ncbi:MULTISPECIES: amino acid ABC transporter substrate-binding protein [unclassified Bradyrhizobium]|uniref:amino acid ABC transporter substrate-binding protein n=1 Tax=unclassified Bradyrhizobium TaxID=2631580 RepID=UPI001BA5228D|nr:MULTISPECIES: amino acid ABC transporter substrate-binding protein [unclassified Bradyrhizobium]MBR1211070.1 amino acid ABC transporter substrate-binding protein [Bradyrhizobium sp. JYMT SZCCT0180]MBR1237575.1 amino acid ABC transporter substrate-binding protein [Bradyrhizobium sp. AUGA SZCCT0182]
MRKIFWMAAALLAANITAAQAQSSDPILNRIKQKKQISIGYREASIPFSFLNDERKPVGYALDICTKVVDAVKQKLELPDLAVNYIAVNPQNRIALVANGTVDIECGSTVNTISRQSQADFSTAHFISATRLLVKTSSGLQEVEDIDGKAIALPINTTPERLIKRLIEEKKLKVKIVPVRDNSEGFLALSTGRADAFSTDDILLFGLRNSAPNPSDYEVVGRPLSFDPYGLMVQKNSTVFLSTVNATIARLIRSGEMQALYAKWFTPLSVELAPDLAAAFKLGATPE